MAETKTMIVESPASLSFAGNPILYKVRTDKGLGTEESFLRIICSAVFSLRGNVDFYEGNLNFSTDLSQPVEDYGTAVFNLSDAAQTLLRNIQSRLDVNEGNTLSSYGLVANISFKTAWVYENQEYESSAEYAPYIYIVPGSFTDYEMIALPDTYLLSIAGNGIAMTRKPEGGILYKGEELIVPVLYGFYNEDNPGMIETKTASSSMYVGGEQVYQGTSFVESNVLSYLHVSTESSEEDGVYVFESSMTRSLSGYFRTNVNGVHFLRFINGFGAVENISVRSKDKLSYEVAGEAHSLVQEASMQPTDRRYATKSQPVGIYELSSGYVPKAWAEWFVQELLTSPRVWMKIGEKWIPALIEAEDKCVIYDRTNPGMPHVDFTVRLAIDGVTGCTLR